MTARSIVIAPSVRIPAGSRRRQKCFVAFEAGAADPGVIAEWVFLHDGPFDNRDQAALHFLGQGCRVFLSPKLPGDEARLPLKEITVSTRLVA